jgi:sulfatase-modifying factor enzyme 1
MKTIPVEKIGPPELATEAAPVIAVAPPPIPPAAVAPPPIPPPPPPPIPSLPPPAPKVEAKKSEPEDPDDDDLTPLPPPMEFITPPHGTPKAAALPKSGPLPLEPPPPGPPPNARSNGAISAPLSLHPSQPTMRVAPPGPMPTFGASVARTPGLTPSGVVKLVVAFVAATGVALTILWMQQSQHADQERQAKEKQMELLRLRESQTPSAASPSATTPDATPATAIALPDEGTSAGCPRGAKRNHAEGHDFCIDAYEYPGGHILPRTGVSWADAEKLCESRGERLCTRREWVASCVGPNGASYPYGNTHDPGRCNIDGQPQTAGSFPHCKSPVGTFDMVGNVSEWIADKVIVGGSALRHDARTRCDSSQKIDPNLGYSDVGFRCCTDAK